MRKSSNPRPRNLLWVAGVVAWVLLPFVYISLAKAPLGGGCERTALGQFSQSGMGGGGDNCGDKATHRFMLTFGLAATVMLVTEIVTTASSSAPARRRTELPALPLDVISAPAVIKPPAEPVRTAPVVVGTARSTFVTGRTPAAQLVPALATVAPRSSGLRIPAAYAELVSA